jgi:hypothetical protein
LLSVGRLELWQLAVSPIQDAGTTTATDASRSRGGAATGLNATVSLHPITRLIDVHLADSSVRRNAIFSRLTEAGRQVPLRAFSNQALYEAGS